MFILVLLIALASFLSFGGCANKEVVANLQRENRVLESEIEQLKAQNQALIQQPPYLSQAEGVRGAQTRENGHLKNAYTIKKGDTLYGIAKKEYGTTKMAKAIFEANRKKIKSMRKLPVGVTIILPQKE